MAGIRERGESREHTWTVSTETCSIVTGGKDRGEVTGRFTREEFRVISSRAHPRG